MRLLVLSDLHVEHAEFAPPPVAADVIVLAGDIHAGDQAIGWARRTFPKHPVVQIAGNHEFYDGEYGEVLARMRERAQAEGVHFLENDAVTIGGVRFLGCTLWTDFRVYEASGRALQMEREQAMAGNLHLLADYHAIDMADAGAGMARRRFSPLDAVRMHEVSRAWLERELAAPLPACTVVVSHHLPSWRSVSPAFAASLSNPAFVSDLDALVARSDLWIHGHTHSSHRYAIDAARVVCNPRGYPGRIKPRPGATAAACAVEFENPAFDPAFIVDLPVRD